MGYVKWWYSCIFDNLFSATLSVRTIARLSLKGPRSAVLCTTNAFGVEEMIQAVASRMWTGLLKGSL